MGTTLMNKTHFSEKELRDFSNSLKNSVIEWGASLVGVADVKAIKPTFASLSEKTLESLDYGISVSIRLSDRVVEDIEDGPTPLYFFHYQRMNILLDEIALKVTSVIQDQNYDALPIPASQVIDWENQKGHVSHKHIACQAGLGWIGRNNLLVTPAYGARVRLVSVLTNMPLTPDRPLREDCGECDLCIPACPVQAIKEQQKDFDHRGCYEKLKAFTKERRIRHQICGICIKACPGNREV